MLKALRLTKYGLTVFYLSISISLEAQTPQFSNFEIQKGFRIKNISNVVQDAAGNIWFGSREGVFRYDGVNFTNFNSNNRKHYIPINIVKKILVDKEEDFIIIYNNKQVYEVDPLQNQHRQIKIQHPKLGIGTKRMMEVHLDGKGGLWAINVQTLSDYLGYKLSIYHSSNRDSFRLVKELETEALFFQHFSSAKNGYLYVNFEQSVIALAPNGKVLNRYAFPRGMPGGHFWDESETLWMITNIYQHKKSREPNIKALEKGIFYLKKGAQNFQEFQIEDLSLLDQNNQLYVDERRLLTYKNRFSIIDRTTRTGKKYYRKISKLENFGLKERISVQDVFQDLSGVYWLSGNILKNLEFDLVEHIIQGGDPFCNNWKCPVRKIIEDEKGNIVFGTSHRVLQYNPQTTAVTTLDCNKNIKVWDTWGLTLQHPYLYVDNRRVNLEDCTFNYIIGNSKKPTFNALDGEGNLWLGEHSSTISVYNIEKETVEPFYALKDTLGDKAVFVRSIFPRKKGPGVWVLTGEHGLYLLHLEKGIVAQYTYDPKNENSMPSPQLYDVFETEDGNLWIGSSMGLSKLETTTNTFTHYKTEDGLPTSKVYSILPESDKGLWLGTAYGISFLDFSSQTFFNFSEENGLGNTEYNTHGAFRSKAGKIYFGGLDGIDAFYAKDFLNPNISRSMPIIVTQFNRFDQELEQLKSSNIQKLDQIILKPANKYFELYFKIADYRRNAENLYSYKMEGYDKDWSAPSRQNFLRYENLPSGTYTLRVKAAITPTVWNEREINISVIKEQYWYKTTTAYVCYVLIILFLIYGLYQFLLNQRLKEEETRQLKEMDTLKTKLYTNITHEFRTPLTVIQGMAEQINENEEVKTLIRRNSKNLLHLVDQLLDMSKLESNKMSLNLTSSNIISFLHYLIQSFASYAATKNIKLNFHSEVHEVIMDFDVEKMQHIIANLLSNAIKFTQKGGEVSLLVAKSPTVISSKKHQPLLKVKIADNGIGIAEKDLPHIFDRFYRVDETHAQVGTGIGLALTKELLELMGGTISVESELMQGTSFSILLPIQNRKEQVDMEVNPTKIEPFLPPPLPRSESPIMKPLAASAKSNLPLLLIIEDNKDVAYYISSILKNQYRLEMAEDGEIGIQQALSLTPDIIICDVMMPKKDGYEVTEFLKNDERTSHIPIIMLTAKVDFDSTMAGLERGADAYLAKPFNKKELKIRLQQLIETRKKIQARYSNLSKLTPSKEPTLQVEDAFLIKIRTIIQNNMGDSEFSVLQLCQEVGMSQSQLYRKIKSLTNKTITQHIRSFRLEKARDFLKNSEMNVSEIAFEVGFNDPLYFSKIFSKEFGIAPSEFRKKG